MVVRINYRESFGRVVGYAMKTDKSPEIVGGNLSARTPDGIIEEFSHLSDLNTRCKKKVAHLAFSLPPKEEFTADQWAYFAQRVADEYRFDQFVAIRHSDTICDHIHLIGNRIGLHGKAVSTSNDRLRMRQLCQKIEKEMYLEKTPSHSKQVRLNKDELEKADRLYRQGKARHPVPHKLLVAEQIKACAYRANSQDTFVALCRQHDIDVKWRVDKGGKPIGVSFKAEGIHFSGTRIGVPLRTLNSKINQYAKNQNNHSRSGNPGLDRSAYGQPRRSPAETARTTTRLAPTTGAGTQQTERGHQGHTGRTVSPGRSPSEYGREETAKIMKTTSNLYKQLAGGLLELFDEIDGEVTISTSRSIYRRKGGLHYE